MDYTCLRDGEGYAVVESAKGELARVVCWTLYQADAELIRAALVEHVGDMEPIPFD